jgi:hypothetical protein
VLLRQVFLLFVPFLFLWLLLTAYRQGAARRAMAAVAMAAAIVVLLIVPFTVYNYSRFQRFVLLNTNAGYAFYLANHPSYGSRFTPASEKTDYQSLVPSELRQLDEAALDQELLKRGLGFVVDDPGRYLLLSLSRLPEYFKFWPDLNSGTISNVARVGSFALFLPFMAYGLVRPLVRLGRLRGGSRFRVPDAPVLLLYLFIITYTAVHVLSWAQVRYRLPVDAVLVIPAALGVTEVRLFVLATLARGRRPRTGRFGAPAS